MSDFFKYIADNNNDSPLLSAMAISGPATGQKGLFQNNRCIYRNGQHELFDSLLTALKNFESPSLITLDSNTFFCEIIADAPDLVICGAGHVSMPIIRLAKMIGFHVTVIDDRQQFCNNANNAGADTTICKPFKHALSELSENKNRYYVIVTRGHEYDIACLEMILQTDYSYVGMMGSKVRTKKVRETLIASELPSEKVNSIHMPIGLPIKAETPEEIAISIISQIIFEKNNNKPSYCYSKDMLKALIAGNCALVTILSRKGSAPRSAGTKMVVLPDGQCLGTVGGGIAEAKITELALACIKNKSTATYAIDMTGKEAADHGMVCGGHIEVFIDTI